MCAVYTRINNSIETKETPLFMRENRALKRSLDVFVSLVVIFFILPPVFLMVSLCLKIYMPGPIFFKQKRTGKNGRIFECYKFRTMDARNHSDQFFDPQMNEYALGNFLRSTSIDELPQFWNVLKGDMSVIGPRPHMLVHDEEYSAVIPEYPLRYAVKPGITGWAQVNGLRGERDLKRVKMRINHDLWYINNWSLFLDVRIMLKTVGVMLRKS